MTRTLARIAPVLLALGLLTACGTTGSTPPAKRPTVTVTATAPTDTPADTTTTDTTTPDETAVIVDITWAQTSETDKDSMCAGLALFGTEWAAEQMRLGAGDVSVDWDRAAQLVEAKCEQR